MVFEGIVPDDPVVGVFPGLLTRLPASKLHSFVIFLAATNMNWAHVLS